MKHCDGCGYAVERCTCPVMTERPCAICTFTGRRREMETVEDKRGLIDYWRCKDKGACAKRCTEVNWNAVICDCK